MGEKKQISEEEIFAMMSHKFVDHKQVVELLYNGYHSRNHVILYGPPGYGKSEMAEAFLMSMGYDEEEIGLFSVNMDTVPEEFFGNLDMEKLYAENKFQMNVHKSVFSKEVVIFEEMFDGTPAALAALKQVLTKKVYYYNDQRYRIKTKFIIACTNKTTSEFNTSNQDTYRALIERFPIIHRMYWSSHKKDDYVRLLRKKFPQMSRQELDGLGSIFQNSRFEEDHISPRIAITATKTYLVNKNIKQLAFVLPDIDNNVLASVQGSFQKVEEKDLTFYIEQKLINKIINKVTPMMDELDKTVKEIQDLPDLYEKIAGYEAMLGYIKDVRVDFRDTVQVSSPNLVETMNSCVYKRLDTLESLVKNSVAHCYSQIDAKKKDAVFVAYSQMAMRRFDLMNELKVLIADEA